MKIANLWAAYAERVLPTHAGESQRQETKRAFYAGAHAFMQGLLVFLDPDAEVTASDLALMNMLDLELQAFKQAVLEGRE